MALIDTSDLLVDPDLVDPMTIIHRKSFVNELGENILSEQGFSTVGSIQPIGGKTLQRVPEALRVADTMSFWVRGPIIADGTCKYPDILVFRGQRFQVQTIFPWTNWGAGYSEGLCVREKVAL